VSLASALADIYEQHRALTPALVVDAARDPVHPLHSQFEWDDSIAGEKYRQTQARQLIRSVRVVQPVGENDQVRVRSWHSIPRSEGRTYMPAEEIKQDPFARQLLLQQMDRDWRTLRARYGHMAEFLDMVRRDLAG
jgi:hypothetical protein